MAGTGGLNPAARDLLDRISPALPDAPLVVALSGGADSAVLAWAAVQAGRRVRAVTVDHGLAASGRLVAAAGRIASVLDMDHSVVPVRTAGSEGDLRVARYAALEAAARPGEVLATGHTADDQAETVLGNLMRGAGARGLAGIPERRGRWVRPMLGLWRTQIREVAAALGLPFVDDPDNVDPGVRRSRIRTETLPYLERAFNPALREALIRTAGLAAADDEELDSRADRVPVMVRADGVRLPAASLATLPAAIAARVARRALRKLMGPYAGDAGDVGVVLAVAQGETHRASLSRGLMAAREGPWVALYGPSPAEPPEAVVLPVPGSVRFGSWTIEATRRETAPIAGPIGRRILVLDGTPSEELLVRAAVEADTIGIAGGTKAVFESLREAGVPARLRPLWPVVEQGGRMIWVVGARAQPGVTAPPGQPAVVLRAKERF